MITLTLDKYEGVDYLCMPTMLENGKVGNIYMFGDIGNLPWPLSVAHALQLAQALARRHVYEAVLPDGTVFHSLAPGQVPPKQSCMMGHNHGQTPTHIYSITRHEAAVQLLELRARRRAEKRGEKQPIMLAQPKSGYYRLGTAKNPQTGRVGKWHLWTKAETHNAQRSA